MASTQNASQKDASSAPAQPAKPDQQTSEKPAAALEEDDEFEDFPVDNWETEDSEAANAGDAAKQHLWEESWDDDDTTDDFSTQLKEEIKKVEAAKRR